MKAIITLTTDFGLQDTYVGMMKGAILSVNPEAAIVDITHSIAPQQVVQAARCIEHSFRYFPPGTVHVIVVDPGVGTERDIVVLKTDEHLFLAPDNGVLSLLLNQDRMMYCVTVHNPRFFRSSVSRTFHGRDIFAPVAAHLTQGISLDQLGPEIQPGALVKLAITNAFLMDDRTVKGEITAIDRFGNIITNIQEQLLNLFIRQQTVRERTFEVRIGSAAPIRLCHVSESYQQVPAGTPLMIIGSTGCLEVAVREGNAARYLGAALGDEVFLSV